MKTLPQHTTATAHQHDNDFYTWTQEQAALLRRVPRGAFALDIDNLAEEIEDIGRGEIREVSSLPRQVLMHLLKLAILPDSASRQHWINEVVTFQVDAVLAFTPGMRQRIELDRVWKAAQNGTTNVLKSTGLQVPAWPTACPLGLDEILVTEFDLGRMLERVKSALHATAANRPQ